MFFKFPKNDKYFYWTQHVKNKMLFYHISEQKIKTILRSPDRREEGVAPNTSAVMKRNDKTASLFKGGSKKLEEIWVMFSAKSKIKDQKSKTQIKDQNFRNQLTMISAWRYPGKSKPGKAIPIPEDILEELGLN